MEILSSQPVSFKLDRKSSQASELKKGISEKLSEYLGNYCDDVLAEYVVVLVCNGKHQIQAKENLEAFLGDQSGEFVVWLWEHLLENIPLLITPDTSGIKGLTSRSFSHDDTNKGCRTVRSNVQQKRPIGAPEIHMKKVSQDIECGDEFQRWRPQHDAPVSEFDNENLDPQLQGEVSDDKTNNCSKATKYMMLPSEILVSRKTPVEDEDQCEKVLPCDSISLSCQPPHLPSRESASRKMQPSISDKSHPRQLSLLDNTEVSQYLPASEMLSHQTIRPRGNVWDRLGKPCDDNIALMGDSIDGFGTVKRKKLEHTGCLGSYNGTTVVNNVRLKRNSQDGNPIDDVNDVQNVGRQKRLSSSDGNYTSLVSLNVSDVRNMQEKATDQDLQGSVPLRGMYSERTRCMTQSCGYIAGPAEHLLKSPDVIFVPKDIKVVHAHCPGQASHVSPVSHVSSHSQHSNLKPVHAEVLDVKLRLEKIECLMNKLRSKQSGSKNEARNPDLLGSGVRNRSVEDMECRTVFVTNVHFAATKEALSSHFSKCGTVVKSILLTEPATGQPSGSAYVVFDCKEAAFKAVSMSGTSFFSRILRIIHKSEVHSGDIQLLRLTKPVKSRHHPLPHRKAHFLPNLHSGSPLQWRRDQAI